MSALTKESIDLLQMVFGPDWQEAWVCWKGRMGGCRVKDLPASIPDVDTYFIPAVFKAGAATREAANIERMRGMVIDDVGTKISKDAFELMAPAPNWVIESSAGNFQYGYCIDMSVQDYENFRRVMKSSPIWGKADGTATAQPFRLPQGKNTKNASNIFSASLISISGAPVDLTGFGSPAQGSQGSASPAMGCGEPLEPQELEALVGAIPNDRSEREYWVSMAHAIWGASDGLGFQTFALWAGTWSCGTDNPEKNTLLWDSITKSSIGTYWLVREAGAAGQAWWGAQAAEAFNDGVGEPLPGAAVTTMLTPDDFRSVVNETDFVHVGTGKFWKPLSVDANVLPVVVGYKQNGDPIKVKATAWMRSHRYVTELSWLPGRPCIIVGKAVGVMGLKDQAAHSIFNLYQAPDVKEVGAINADPWCDLVRKLWPGEADEIFNWFAHRVQRPGVKCNHALVLGGASGIGKDTVLEAVRRAVGIGNCHEILPSDLKAGFNDYIQSVMLVINELRDDETISQYAFYEKSKTLIAAPPYTLSVNSKYIKKYVVPNVCGVVMTTNHKVLGLYLPADDRRHLVCWSDEDAISEGDVAFKALWAWLDGGGFDHVAAWLRARDLSGFDCKAPPRKTAAFFEIADAGGSPGEAAMKSKLEDMGRPKTLLIRDLKPAVFNDEDEDAALNALLTDPKYRRVLAEILGKVGYRLIKNPAAKADGRWRIDGRKEYVYGRKDVDMKELVALAGKLGAITNPEGGVA